MKQSAHHIRHEKQGDQDRDQREGKRDDGKTNFFCAVQGCCVGAFAHLHVASNVLDHHNRIVHDKARGNGQGHQGEVVDGEAQQIHHPKGAQQRQGHGHTGDQGGLRAS